LCAGLSLPITEQHTEESLCFAHIYAVAGVAGVNYSAQRYDYGIDGKFNLVVNRGNKRIDSGFAVDYQAKATVNWELVDGNIVYDLEAETYNNFANRSSAEATMILILLCLPKDRNSWHGTSCNETVLRHCCYWHAISGEPTSNTAKKRIFIPAEQLLTPTSLNQILALEKARRESQVS
jgi:Domain of unknown function (DUF4365)